MTKIKSKIGEPACYEQLAEECAELGHAALKVARILRNENPTPCDEAMTRKQVSEELGDVLRRHGACTLIIADRILDALGYKLVIVKKEDDT